MGVPYTGNRSTPIDSDKWNGIKLDCGHEEVIGLWRAKTWGDVLEAVHVPAGQRQMVALPIREEIRQAAQYGRSAPTDAQRMDWINRLAGFHGVQHIGVEYGTGVDVYMLNSGDTYAPTLLFRGRTMSITTYADVVEINAKKIKFADQRQAY